MIKIDLQHKDKILSAIDSAQVGCRVNLLNWDMLLKSIERIESYLSPFKKKELVGLVVIVNCFGKQRDLPRSYKWEASGTFFKLEYRKLGWYFIYAHRCVLGDNAYLHFDFTYGQEDKMIKLVRNGQRFWY